MEKNELTQTQLDINELLLQGMSNAEIANSLHLSEKTIKFHITTIFQFSGCKSRARHIANYYLAIIKKFPKTSSLPIGGV